MNQIEEKRIKFFFFQQSGPYGSGSTGAERPCLKGCSKLRFISDHAVLATRACSRIAPAMESLVTAATAPAPKAYPFQSRRDQAPLAQR